VTAALIVSWHWGCFVVPALVRASSLVANPYSDPFRHCIICRHDDCNMVLVNCYDKLSGFGSLNGFGFVFFAVHADLGWAFATRFCLITSSMRMLHTQCC
jgi:hypothetical protein